MLLFSDPLSLTFYFLWTYFVFSISIFFPFWHGYLPFLKVIIYFFRAVLALQQLWEEGTEISLIAPIPTIFNSIMHFRIIFCELIFSKSYLFHLGLGLGGSLLLKPDVFIRLFLIIYCCSFCKLYSLQWNAGSRCTRYRMVSYLFHGIFAPTSQVWLLYSTISLGWWPEVFRSLFLNAWKT